MVGPEELKRRSRDEINAHRQELTALSLRVHGNPELSLEEEQSARWLGKYLEGKGFAVTGGSYGLPTAFEAVYGRGDPHIGIMAEYDALPGIGHACGHNIIATAALGAGVAARMVADALGGTIHVIGTPGEEGQGGKILMANNGAFSNLDAAMMVHPGSHNMAGCLALAVAVLEVEFFGRAAHAAAAPDRGINALEAMIVSFNAINSLRQHLRDGSRIHGIITDGGQAPNIVPAHSAGVFYVRAMEDRYLEELKEKVIDCFQAGSRATGSRLEHRWSEAQYSTMTNNPVMSRLFAQNLQALGRTMEPYEDKTFGSTDMGNVSFITPSIHPIIAVSPPGVPIHTVEFESYAKSEAAHQAMVDGATAMAWTIVDLMSEPSSLAQAREAFRKEQGV